MVHSRSQKELHNKQSTILYRKQATFNEKTQTIKFFTQKLPEVSEEDEIVTPGNA